MSRGTFHLVGHDWVAAIGWSLSNQYPEWLLSWSALSVPHIQAFGEAIVSNPIQKLMSAYIGHFQFPWLPEFNIKKHDHKLLKWFWKNSSKEEVDDFLSVFREHGTVSAALNYYRGNYRMLKSGGGFCDKKNTKKDLNDKLKDSRFFYHHTEDMVSQS